MTITLLGGRYRLKPYQTHGRRCWELYVGRRTSPECYPDSLGFALRWIAEYEIRNGLDDTADIGAALERYVTHGEPYVVDGNATFITQFNHNCIGQSMREPMKTITCSPGHFGLVTAFLVSYYGNSHGAQSVGEPLPTITTRDRFGLVTCEVNGSTYRVADVHLRMLNPEELKLAQGFDPSYVIDHYPDGSRVTKSEQTAKIGNSVCPPMAEKIVAAQLGAA